MRARVTVVVLCTCVSVCLSVCLSVCPSVTALAASASAYTCDQLYRGVHFRLFLDKYVWILPSVRKLWRELPNMPLSRNFRTNETQQLREGQLVGPMLLKRLATDATGVEKARHRRKPTQGSEALVGACAVYTQRCVNVRPA